jgi:hypothetical protein
MKTRAIVGSLHYLGTDYGGNGGSGRGDSRDYFIEQIQIVASGEKQSKPVALFDTNQTRGLDGRSPDPVI